MAQYKKNFYSSSLYGRIKAFYGEYLTDIFDAQQPFTSKVTAKMLARLPRSFYEGTNENFEVITAGSWQPEGTKMKTKTVGQGIQFIATGDNIKVYVQLQSEGIQSAEAIMYKEELINGVYQWVQKETKTLSTFSVAFPGQERELAFSSYGFADYKVVIKAKAATGFLILKGASLRTADFSFEISSSKDKVNWSAWEAVPLNKTLTVQDVHDIAGESPTTFNAIQYVKGKVILVSSDNRTTPIVDRIELRSEDSGLYEVAGQYTVEIDMKEVAKTAGVTFKRVNKIRWSEVKPASTTLDIRSSSSIDGIFWGPITAPYRKATNRLRLKQGVTTHSVTLGPFQESNRFDHAKIISFLNWETNAYYPKEAKDISISYIFSKTKTNVTDPVNVLQVITDLANTRSGKITFTPQPYFLTVKMVRANNRGTPVVDLIDVNQTMAYKEEVNVTSQNVSMVDGAGSGRKELLTIESHGFKLPRTTGHIPFNITQINSAMQRYELKDQTRRPSDVMLYFLSEESKGAKTNTTGTGTEKVVAQVKQRRIENGETTGSTVHYSYGAGEVQYLRPYERELGSDFTPSLKDELRYKYFVMNGWPDAVHRTANAQTLEDLAIMYEVSTNELKDLNPDRLMADEAILLDGQEIKIANKTFNDAVSMLFADGTPYALKSSHNAAYDKRNGKLITDMSSEKIRIEVPVEPDTGSVPWTSEEKIYTGVINPEDLRGEFLVTQYSSTSHADFEREYLVRNNDTWESIAALYEVEAPVLRAVNESAVLEVGRKIKIPPNIILPEIPAEVEIAGAMPYKVKVVADSARKKNGVRIDESFIQTDNLLSGNVPLEIMYEESEPVTVDVVRGVVANGMDPIGVNSVARIISVKRKDGTLQYQQWNETLKVGDYKLVGDYISWSPSGAGVVEPARGSTYTVTFTRKTVASVKVHIDTSYFEKIGTDIVWRSPEIKVIDGICSPSEDFKTVLPAFESFQGFSGIYKNVDYVIEDNDLWVETKVEKSGDAPQLIGTLNGKDPSKNWHPTINTGYYYLKEQEKYLYSEALTTVLSEKELPTAEQVEYVSGPTGIGILLSPRKQNFMKDTGLENKIFKTAVSFTSASI